MAENHHINGSTNGDFEDDEFTECGRFSLLDSLARRDEPGRAVVLDRLERAQKRWRETAAAAAESSSENAQDQDSIQKLHRLHLWTALALRWNAPFMDIRTRMKKLLEDAKVSQYIHTPAPLSFGRSLVGEKANTCKYVCIDGEIHAMCMRLMWAVHYQQFITTVIFTPPMYYFLFL